MMMVVKEEVNMRKESSTPGDNNLQTRNDASAATDGTETPSFKKRARRPMDEHTRKRRAFERRMNKMLRSSNNENNALAKRRKLQRMKKAVANFNTLLRKEKMKRAAAAAVTASTEKSPLSEGSDTKKNDISVYDFESDEETDIFIGTYTSKFSPQLLTKIEQTKEEEKTQSKEAGGGQVETAAAAHSTPKVKTEEYAQGGEMLAGRKRKMERTGATMKHRRLLNNKTTKLRKNNNVASAAGTSRSEQIRRIGNPLKRRLAAVAATAKMSESAADAAAEGRKLSEDKKNEITATKRKGAGGEKTARKSERFGRNYELFRGKFATKIKSEHAEFNAEQVEKALEKKWSQLSENEKKCFKQPRRAREEASDSTSEDTEEESKLSSNADTEEESKRRSSSPLTLPTANVRSKKASNIFAGLKFEKVCQICGKPGDTVRCRGPCCGYFHAECVQKVTIEIKDIAVVRNAAGAAAAAEGGSAKKGGRRKKISLLVKEEENDEVKSSAVTVAAFGETPPIKKETLNESSEKKTPTTPSRKGRPRKYPLASEPPPSLVVASNAIVENGNVVAAAASAAAETVAAVKEEKPNSITIPKKRRYTRLSESERLNDGGVGDLPKAVAEEAAAAAAVVVVVQNHKEDDEDEDEDAAATVKAEKDTKTKESVVNVLDGKQKTGKTEEEEEDSSKRANGKSSENGIAEDDEDTFTKPVSLRRSRRMTNESTQKPENKDGEVQQQQQQSQMENTNEKKETPTTTTTVGKEKPTETTGPSMVNGVGTEVTDTDEAASTSDISEILSLSNKAENAANSDFRCNWCADGILYPCFICGFEEQENTGETERYACYLASCGRVFHKECLKAWPQATWSGKLPRCNSTSVPSKETLMCPQHYCHTCISDNPAVLKNKQNNERLVRCVKCPTAYHQTRYHKLES